MEASCWVARKIFLSPAMASSSARTLDSRPTTNGVIMYGKMTTSRMGIIGRRFVSDFSFEVSIVSPQGDPAALGLGVPGPHARQPARARPACPALVTGPGVPGPYPAFSNSVRLIFCDSTISLVTWNSRTFL